MVGKGLGVVGPSGQGVLATRLEAIDGGGNRGQVGRVGHLRFQNTTRRRGVNLMTWSHVEERVPSCRRRLTAVSTILWPKN